MQTNDKLQTLAIAIGVIAIFVGICGLFVYGLNKETFDSEQEYYDEQFKEARELRKKYFQQNGAD